MAINVLKKSKTEFEKAAEDAKVREVVEATLGEIEKNGDAAIRELSKKFDKKNLIPLNNNYPEILLDNSFDVIGVVIQKNENRKIKHYS